MPKFFRNIRIKSIELSKVKNYLLYAVGEIILVVAGILIAVYIGEESERIKNEADVEKAITQVANDLEHDILEIEERKKIYEGKDSLIVLLLQDKLNESNIRNNLNIRYLVVTYWPMSITTLGYDALTKNLSAISLKDDSLLSSLNKIYINHGKQIENNNSRVKEETGINIRYMKDNFPFFAGRQPLDTALSQKEINFYLHDWHYKNQLASYESATMRNLVVTYNEFEVEALHALIIIHKKRQKKLEIIVKNLCTKFDFDTLRLMPASNGDLNGIVDTLVNYIPSKTRILMMNNTSTKSVKVWGPSFYRNKTTKEFFMSVPPHTISFITENLNWHLYFTDDNEKPLGSVQIGRRNGYLEIK
jgi:hypothetical protein